MHFVIHSLTSQDFLEQLFMAYAPAKMQGKSEIKSAYGQHSFFLGLFIYRNSTLDLRNKPARSKTARLDCELTKESEGDWEDVRILRHGT